MSSNYCAREIVSKFDTRDTTLLSSSTEYPVHTRVTCRTFYIKWRGVPQKISITEKRVTDKMARLTLHKIVFFWMNGLSPWSTFSYVSLNKIFFRLARNISHTDTFHASMTLSHVRFADRNIPAVRRRLSLRQGVTRSGHVPANRYQAVILRVNWHLASRIFAH